MRQKHYPTKRKHTVEDNKTTTTTNTKFNGKRFGKATADLVVKGVHGTETLTKNTWKGVFSIIKGTISLVEDTPHILGDVAKGYIEEIKKEYKK